MSIEVILYVVPNCPLCEDTRLLLRARQVRFLERDVANDYSALRSMYRKTRQGLVPVLEVEGKTIVRPTAEQIDSLLV